MFEFNDVRAHTGAMKFDNDWPGVFIRGKDALNYAVYLGLLLKELDLKFELTDEQVQTKRSLMGLLDDLLACDTSVLKPEHTQHGMLMYSAASFRYEKIEPAVMHAQPPPIPGTVNDQLDR